MKHSHWSLIVQNLQILKTGNTGNIGDADIVGFDNCEKVETFKKLESVNIIMANGKRFNKHLSIRHFILSMAVIILSIVYMPANAASTDNTAPENIVDYAEQQLDKLKREGVSASAIAEEMISPLEKKTVQQAGVLQGDSGLTGDYNEGYYALSTLNAGLPPLSEPPNLSTPLATLEFFQSAVIKQQYDLAAYALNMNLIDEKQQSSQAMDLGRVIN